MASMKKPGPVGIQQVFIHKEIARPMPDILDLPEFLRGASKSSHGNDCLALLRAASREREERGTDEVGRPMGVSTVPATRSRRRRHEVEAEFSTRAAQKEVVFNSQNSAAHLRVASRIGRGQPRIRKDTMIVHLAIACHCTIAAHNTFERLDIYHQKE